MSKLLNCVLRWRHLTWPGDLTWYDLGPKFLHKMRKGWMNSYAKFGVAARRHFAAICEKPMGGHICAPPAVRGLNEIWLIVGALFSPAIDVFRVIFSNQSTSLINCDSCRNAYSLWCFYSKTAAKLSCWNIDKFWENYYRNLLKLSHICGTCRHEVFCCALRGFPKSVIKFH